MGTVILPAPELRGMPTERDEISPLVGQVVVVDTATTFLYVGALKEWQEHFVILTDVDAHDTAEGRSGKEMYALEARRNGHQRNRREVCFRKSLVVSLSRLEDVIAY